MNTYNCFEQVEMRIGRIIDVVDFPQARKPAYKLWIDFGEIGVRQSSAQIMELYGRDDLLERLIVAATNLPPRRIAGFKSEVLVLGTLDQAGRVVLLQPMSEVKPGSRVF